MADPRFPEGAGLSSPTVGQNAGDPNSGMLIQHPTAFEFTDPNTGKTSVEQSPLHDPNDPTKPLIEANPFFGENIHSKPQLAGMKGARALGAGLGVYSALMSFGDDSDQDVVTAAMNAGLTGYSTYAQFAQLAQHFDRRGQNQLADKLRAHANDKASQAFLQQNQHRRKVNLQNAKLVPNAGFPLMVNNPRPKVAGKPVAVLGPGVNASENSDISLGPPVTEWNAGDTTFNVDNSSIANDSPPPPSKKEGDKKGVKEEEEEENKSLWDDWGKT